MDSTNPVDELVGRVAHDVDKGLVPAAQVAVAVDGHLVVAESFGTATADHRLPLFSASKVLPSAAVWRLFANGEVRPDQPVVEVLPWFVGGGKEGVTIEHLLLHTAGLANAPLGPPEWFDAEQRRAKMATWYCKTPAGETFAYHPTSAAWVLSEVISSIVGSDHRSAIHSLTTAPHELPAMLGIDDTTVRVCDVVAVGAERADDPGLPPEVTDDSLLRFNDHDTRALGVPGAGGFARAADMAMLYQALLFDEHNWWSRPVLDDVTGTVRVTQLDVLRGVSANRTRGLICAGDDGHAAMRGFASTCSSAAFGHDGAAGQVAWADPATGMSCCFLTAGIDRDVARQYRRAIGISNRAAAVGVAAHAAKGDR